MEVVVGVGGHGVDVGVLDVDVDVVDVLVGEHGSVVVVVVVTTRVVVDDDGPGIPPPDRERVFERFTRLDDSRTRHQGGSGLGLAVVRSIVVRHHGQIRVEDSPLGGAGFVAEFPAGTRQLGSVLRTV